MADNTTLNAGAGGDTIATDDIGGIKHQLVKIEYGDADSATQVSDTNPLPVDDAGGSLTVDGTVTADAGTGPWPVTDNGGSLTVDGSGTFTVTDDGSFTLAANSGVDIGDVDVLSVLPGSGATNLGKAEDALHSTGDVGVLALAVRRAADTPTSDTDGDYEPLKTDANGHLKVEIFDGGQSHTVDGTVTANAGSGTFTVTDDGSFTLAANSGVDVGDVTINNAAGASAVNIQDGGNVITVDGSGTFTVTDDGSFTLAANSGVDIGDVDVTSIIPGSGTTNLGKAEDAAHGTGDVGVLALAVRRAADTPTSDTDGDYEPLKTDANGHLKVEIFDGGQSHTVDGTVTANAGSGTFTVTDDGSFTLAANSGVDVGDVTINNAAGASAVNIQDGGNSITVDGTVSANLNASTNTIEVVGDVAHDIAVSGNPVLMGGWARTTTPTAVQDGDAVRMQCDKFGRPVTRLFAPRDRVVKNRLALTTTTETTLIAAGSAGVFRDLVSLIMSNESATECRVDIRDATAGTVRLSIDLAADGGGAVSNYTVPFPQTTAANNWTAQLSAGVSTVYITAIAVETA